MLRTLRIRELVIIEDLTVEFAPGLNLLTGETGAGKSILVDALGLIAGGRADRALLRAGAEKATVEALFEIGADSPVRAWARECGEEERIEEGQLVIRRELPAEGSGRVTINGSPCTVAMLREWGGRLIELHGQHEQQRLLSPGRHLALLDEFADHEALLADVAEAYAAVREARRKRERWLLDSRERSARMEELRRALREIDSVEPRPGEMEKLDRERELLRNASRVCELLDELVELTYEGERGAAALAARAARRAEELAGLDPGLADLAGRLEAATVEIQDVGTAFRDYRQQGDFDPRRLDEVESRRVAIERLCLKYGENEDAVLGYRERAQRELDSLAEIGVERERAEEELRSAEARYVAADADLDRSRREATERLRPAVERQFRSLALKRARFEVELSGAGGEPVGDEGSAGPALGPTGGRKASFLLATNPGEPFVPLIKTASGGELSRVMLALHVVVDGAGDGRVLVFDEVDAGVGGAVADAVGSRLSRLARRQQVLCATHLPQVAVYADRHLAVRKFVRDGRTRTEIDELAGEARIGELARMLGGKRATATSRRHASELLDAAARGSDSRRADSGRGA